ncbi:sensor histidine kinase [Thalassobacillus pellis]|uniref:sensor histidine kinase n=1 Tax=Thalassobacillus pellis TaxID=748008 RepID=UPI0019603FF0|nr:sensor histidine kinase [Thalassobacillus pellis]MBM7552649.1 CitB family two-component system sensor histidine kinase CitS [Thalassobacillus pellis]
MEKLLRVSLQVKILGLVTFLLLLVLSLVTIMIVYMESKEDVRNSENIAVQTAITLSYMPAIQDAFISGNPTEEMNDLAGQIMEEVDAATIKILNRQGEIYGYAGDDAPGTAVREDHYRALVFGSDYSTYNNENEHDQILKGISPIIIDYGDYKKVEGSVAVEFKMKTIYQEISNDIKKIIAASAGVFILGIAGSFLLARSIRKDTLGLEPYDIAALYRERNAVLQSVKEGMIAFDHCGRITMANMSAREILDLPEFVEGRSIFEVISSPKLLELVNSERGLVNKELQYHDKTVIINSSPILENDKRTGTVVSFRDKTEIKQMIDAISEVRQYSEDLRAQAHEFTSKLYVIMGLIQLGKYQEAITLIQEEAEIQGQVTEMFFKEIRDEKIQAILLGKFAKASEKKISFIIEEGSSLHRLPDHIGLSPLLIIIGNLINNAFDAVSNQPNKKVSFFITDLGNDIVFEIADEGSGLKNGMEEKIFQKGFSLKGKNRGYGLSNVMEEINYLNGSIEVSSNEQEGTIFTVILPKISSQAKLL